MFLILFPLFRPHDLIWHNFINFYEYLSPLLSVDTSLVGKFWSHKTRQKFLNVPTLLFIIFALVNFIDTIFVRSKFCYFPEFTEIKELNQNDVEIKCNN